MLGGKKKKKKKKEGVGTQLYRLIYNSNTKLKEKCKFSRWRVRRGLGDVRDACEEPGDDGEDERMCEGKWWCGRGKVIQSSRGVTAVGWVMDSGKVGLIIYHKHYYS